MTDLPAKPRLSFAAVVAVAAGAMGCLIVPGVVAVVAGVIALRQTRHPDVRGRGMAVAGILLGLIFSLVTSIAVYSAYRFGIRQVQTLTPLVINAALAGDHAAAAPYTTMSPQQLADLRDRMHGWGQLTRIIDPGWTGRKIDGHPEQFVLTGTAVFDQAGKKPFLVVFDAREDDVKVVNVIFKPSDAAGPAAATRPSATAPATQALER